MIAIISLLIVVSLSILVTRIATIALTHTGLSKESARFQARSAFTGAGFTTTESEGVVNHPVRRRIILLLMLLGNAGIVTAVSSLILTFVGGGESSSLPLKIFLLAAGLLVLWTIASSQWVDRHLCRVIDWTLKRYTRLDVQDYASLMRLAGEYRIAELRVEPEDWTAHKTLTETQLRAEGVLVLGIKRPDGTYLGTPKGQTKILPEDTLLVYGRVTALAEIDERRRDSWGDREHEEAIAEQAEVVQQEVRQDPVEKTSS